MKAMFFSWLLYPISYGMEEFVRCKKVIPNSEEGNQIDHNVSFKWILHFKTTQILTFLPCIFASIFFVHSNVDPFYSMNLPQKYFTIISSSLQYPTHKKAF